MSIISDFAQVVRDKRPDSSLGPLDFPDLDGEDDIWEEYKLFDGEWVMIQDRRTLYESPNVPQIYEDHKFIFRNMGVSKPHESDYVQNIDSGEFSATLHTYDYLPSGMGNGKFRITVDIGMETPPQGENDFGLVDYTVSTYMKYSMPSGIDWLPRILANPLNRLFRFAFMFRIGKEILESDAEFAREKTREYQQYLRKYHGEEPVQTKSRRADYNPQPEEGVFFQ